MLSPSEDGVKVFHVAASRPNALHDWDHCCGCNGVLQLTITVCVLQQPGGEGCVKMRQILLLLKVRLPLLCNQHTGMVLSHWLRSVRSDVKSISAFENGFQFYSLWLGHSSFVLVYVRIKRIWASFLGESGCIPEWSDVCTVGMWCAGGASDVWWSGEHPGERQPSSCGRWRLQHGGPGTNTHAV